MNTLKVPHILYGGDYNPEQWEEAVWAEDMKYFKELSVNTVTLPVFAWAKIQPEEDVYNFEWLDKIVDIAQENNINIIMATPTAAPPAWMYKKYPKMLPVDDKGVRRKYGGRTQFCPNNSDYRRLSKKIAQEMAIHYRNRKNIIMWHVNNEYGTGCYCETCRQKFIQWLQKKYHTLDNLNEKWYTNFWGHTYYDWQEVEAVSKITELLPNRLGNRDGTNFQGMAIDYRRFLSNSIMSAFENEANILREITPNIPVTTNIWGVAPWLDLFRVGEKVDIVSWDSYPAANEPYTVSSLKHDIIRSLKKEQSFILMEQTPNQQNWQSYNSLKRPGVMRLQSYQAIAHGADGSLFFQMRQSKGACEKYHAAMIPHAGHLETRIGRELKTFGAELKKLEGVVVGTIQKAKVAIIMNWENWWSVEYSSGPSVDLDYFGTIHMYYKMLHELKVPVDIIEGKEGIEGYDVILAPTMHMISQEQKGKIENFVKNGGTFLSTVFSGYTDEYDLVHLGGYPGALREVLGIWIEEIDALYPESIQYVRPCDDKESGAQKELYKANFLCEIIHLEGAKALAEYTEDFYANTPCVTCNEYGKGKAYHIGTKVEEEFLKDLVDTIIPDHCRIKTVEGGKEIEITKRLGKEENYIFVMNHSEMQESISCQDTYIDMLTDTKIPLTYTMQPKEVLILREKKV